MNKVVILAGFCVLGACQHVSGITSPQCEMKGFTPESVSALKRDQFKNLDDSKISALALALRNCAADPAPQIRDGLVYQTWSWMLRQDKLDTVTKIELFDSQIEVLENPEDPLGFGRPFAALNLSEIVRADRIDPFLSKSAHARIINTTANYIQGITDYRGFNQIDGWRHGVAHAADLSLQLTLNPEMSDQQIAKLRQALSQQIAPASGHAYIFGEPERLARPVYFMMKRGRFSNDDWKSWFEKVVDPHPFSSWNDVYDSEKGLAKLHNTKAFLNSIYINASLSENANVKSVLPYIRSAVLELP